MSRPVQIKTRQIRLLLSCASLLLPGGGVLQLKVKLFASPVACGQVFPRDIFFVFSDKFFKGLERVEADATFRVIALVHGAADGSFFIFHPAGSGSG